MEFLCGGCGHRISAPDELAGNYIVCVRCERMGEIPEPAPMSLEDPSVARLLTGLRCPRCGYTLRGLRENTCPECGRRFDPLYLVRTRWGQGPNQSPLVVTGAIAAVVILLLLWTMCSGIWR